MKKTYADTMKNIICEVLLDIYIVIAIYLNNGVFPNNIILFLTIAVLSGYTVHTIMPYICDFKINPVDDTISNLSVFALSSCICFIPLVISWLAYWPGGMNLDALGQWDQIHQGYLNDWHPVMSTLFIYAITRIYDNFPFYIFIQILLFSISMGYLATAVNKMRIPLKYNILAVVYVTVNPATPYIMLCMYKDAIFAIFAVILTAQLLNIFRTNGEWIKDVENSIAFIFVIVMTTLVRHNGIFITLPVISLLLILYGQVRKRTGILAICCIVTCIIVKGPLYNSLGVVRHDNITGELSGVPMAILANELVTSPQTVDTNTHTFLNSIASDEEWNKHYISGEWDSVKWDFGGTELLKNNSLTEVIWYTMKSISRSPTSAFESFANNTKVAFQFVGNIYWNDEPYIEDNEYGIVMSDDNVFRRMLIHFSDFTANMGISTLFWSIGAYIVLLFLFATSGMINGNLKILLFVLPIISYNLITALMLSGPSYRYFYFNVPVFGAIMMCMVCRNDICTN